MHPHTFYQQEWGCSYLAYLEERIIREAQYIIEHDTTVRDAAHVLHVSKSTVHKDVTRRLPPLNAVLAREVRKILDRNKAERHIRGGQATSRKYRGTTQRLQQ